MSNNFFDDIDDDLFSHPSLAQYTQPTPTKVNNVNRSTHSMPSNPPNLSSLNLNNNYSDSNSRKRKSNALTSYYSPAPKRKRLDLHPTSSSRKSTTTSTNTNGNSNNNHSPSTNRFFQQNNTNSDYQNASNPSISNNHHFNNSNNFNSSNISNHQNLPNHSNHSNNTVINHSHHQRNQSIDHNKTSSVIIHHQQSHHHYGNIEAPECSHKLPMTQRTTRKKTANYLRKFWVCDQQPQCRMFIWDDQWQRDLNIKKRQQKRDGVNVHQVLMNKKLTLCTELLCIDPIPLVEVAIHPPEPQFVAAVKRCTNASWNNDKKRWCIPLDQHSILIRNQTKASKEGGYALSMNVVPDDVIRIVNRWKRKKIKSEESATMKEALKRLPRKLRITLYEFQKEGFHFAVQKEGRCLIADEMGLGKSIQAIAVAMYFKSDWPLLIITPSTLGPTWKKEILKWLSDVVDSEDINLIRKTNDKMIDYDFKQNRNKPVCKITIISYGLATRKQAELTGDRNLFGMVICDESHALKNPKTQRCKVILPLIQRGIKRAILLSGTPLCQRPAELHSQIDCLRPGEFMSYKKYTIRYCEGKQGRFGWECRGAMHLKELHAMIKHRVMIRREKKEVMDCLPEKLRTYIYIECDSSLAKKLKKKMAKHDELMDQMSQSISAYKGNMEEEKQCIFEKKNKTAMELYLLTGKSKIPKIKEYIKELFEMGHKFLVFAHHLEVMDEIEKSVKNFKEKPGYIRIDGSVSTDKRQLLVDEFQNDSDIRIAILSITAAGTGLTLTAASTVVFAELSWGPMTLLQCEDRAHRISQTKKVNIVYLLGEGSMDDKMWPMVKNKMDVISQTISGKQEKMEVEEYKKQFVMDQKKGEKENNCDNGNDDGMDGGKTKGKEKCKQKTITSMLQLNPKNIYP